MGGFAIRNLILFNQALWGNGHGNMLQQKKLSGGGLWRRSTVACGSMVCQYSQWALWCWSMEKYKELGIIFLVLLALRGVRELVSRFGMIYSVEIKL